MPAVRAARKGIQRADLAFRAEGKLSPGIVRAAARGSSVEPTGRILHQPGDWRGTVGPGKRKQMLDLSRARDLENGAITTISSAALSSSIQSAICRPE